MHVILHIRYVIYRLLESIILRNIFILMMSYNLYCNLIIIFFNDVLNLVYNLGDSLNSTVVNVLQFIMTKSRVNNYKYLN